MTRKQLLAHIQAAAAVNDTAKLTRLYIENRISRPVFDEYVRIGTQWGDYIRKRDSEVK